MAKEPKIQQPSSSEQREYLSLRDNDPTIASIYGTKKKYKIRWLKNCQIEKLDRLFMHKKTSDNEDASDLSTLDEMVEDARIACKVAAVYILDGWIKLKFYPFLWRWFYFVKQYSAMQLFEILEAGKKKVPLTQFFLVTMSLTEARGTLMTMTMREAERILREQSTARNSPTASSSSGSSSPGKSSLD